MSFEELNNKLEKIKTEYQFKKEALSDYFEEISLAIFDYSKASNDFSLSTFFSRIISCEDLYGYEYCEKMELYNIIYYFSNKNNEKIELNYDDITRLLDETINSYKKEKGYEIC